MTQTVGLIKICIIGMEKPLLPSTTCQHCFVWVGGKSDLCPSEPSEEVLRLVIKLGTRLFPQVSLGSCLLSTVSSHVLWEMQLFLNYLPRYLRVIVEVKQGKLLM
jgi:hypothetical protein